MIQNPVVVSGEGTSELVTVTVSISIQSTSAAIEFGASSLNDSGGIYATGNLLEFGGTSTKPIEGPVSVPIGSFVFLYVCGFHPDGFVPTHSGCTIIHSYGQYFVSCITDQVAEINDF